MKITEHPKSPEFSLIYVNFRSADLLVRSLESLQEKGILGKNVEVILANNDPEEEEKLRYVAAKFSCTLLSFSENRGFGWAVNRAALKARGRYIGCINPDTECVSESFAPITSLFEKYPKIGIIGARVLGEDGAPEAWSSGKRLSLWQLLRNNAGFPAGRHLWSSKKNISVGWVSGATLFIRKELFHQLSGFDERFFLYFEDVDLCYRAKRNGFLVIFCPKISFLHKGGKSHVSRKSQKDVFYASQKKYFEKHRPLWEGLFLKAGRTLSESSTLQKIRTHVSNTSLRRKHFFEAPPAGKKMLAKNFER